MDNESTNQEILTDSEERSEPFDNVKVKRKRSFVREFFSFVIIIFFIFIFRSIVMEPFRIPTGSMIPTLMIGDFIVVNKASYGLKVPFSDFSGDPVYVFGKSNPARGDVIVFKYPKDNSLNYVKRVVGLPGDTLEIKDKTIYINGEKIISTEVDGKSIMRDMDEKFKDYNFKFYKTKTGNHSHVIQQDNDSYFQNSYEKRKIPEGKFFVMGDNRDYSYDSRYWGFVSHEHIKGKAFLIWFSMIIPNADNNFKFRPWRIGKEID